MGVVSKSKYFLVSCASLQNLHYLDMICLCVPSSNNRTKVSSFATLWKIGLAIQGGRMDKAEQRAHRQLAVEKFKAHGVGDR